MDRRSLHRWFLAAWLVIVWPPVPSLAATPQDVPCCQDMDAAQMERVQQITAAQYMYDCCDDTIATCLQQQAEACPLARRLTGEICRRVKAGESDEAIDHALQLRARSMMPDGPTVPINLTGVPSLGEASAPVVLVEYACLRCPFCARLTPELEREITSGSLQGKVRLYYKLFPIKGHEGSTAAGLAALAAHDQGRFWDYLSHAYAHFDNFSEDRLPTWAQELGLDMSAFTAVMADPATRARLVDSKKEGMGNGVKSTPTLFINGRLYQADLNLDLILDVLGEEVERVGGAE